MNILQNNPYRLLGVYSNSPTKERLANHNRMKAFLKVGKTVTFPLDLPQYLTSINRTETSVTDAEAKLTLPNDQMLYALFWFVKMTPLDEVVLITSLQVKWLKQKKFGKKENVLHLCRIVLCVL